MPISTFPCHDYDEDEYILKPAGLRDTHSEGKVIDQYRNKNFSYVRHWTWVPSGLSDPVGTLIAERPPDRSVRARLRIRLL